MTDQYGPPTEPLRPPEVGTEPIPEHARRPLVPPAQRREPTVAGLPTKLVAVAAFVVLLFFVLGFLAGRSLGGGGDEAAPATEAAGGRAEAACGRAVSAALGMIEVQRAALANRTEFTEAAVTGDEGRMDELNEALRPLAEQVQQLEGRVTTAAAACEAGGRKGGKGGKGGKRGKGGGGDG